MAHNTADRKSIRKAEKQARQSELARGEFIKWMMESTNGRQWVNDLLISCHIFHNPMNDSDRWTSFALGEMNIGQRILADIMLFCPDQYVIMQRESVERTLARTTEDDNEIDMTNTESEDASQDI